MADDTRLYMFECGTLKCHVENIKMNLELDRRHRPRPRRLAELQAGAGLLRLSRSGAAPALVMTRDPHTVAAFG